MRTVSRLRLLCLLLRPSSPNPTVFTLPCCPLCYSLPCRNHDWPIRKNIISSSRALFRMRLILANPLQYSFWWTRRESNPRPEHFSLCFIQQYGLLYINRKYLYNQFPFILKYSSRKSRNLSIQSSRFSIKTEASGCSSTVIRITNLSTGIPVRSSNITAYAEVCIKYP